MSPLLIAARNEVHLRVKGGNPPHQCASCETELVFGDRAVVVVSTEAQKVIFYCPKCATFVDRGWKPT